MAPRHAARGTRAERDLHDQPGAAVCVARPGKDPFDRYTKKNGDIVCSGIIESARAALEAGIKVGLGTDSSCRS